MRAGVVTLALTVGTILAGGCARPAPAASASAAEPYRPGFGEIMSLQQMRHTKLWFAGQATNWELASYELDELAEGFDDVVKFYPTHKESPVSPKDVIPTMATPALDALKKAVDKKDRAQFERAYDELTTGCNTCHQAMNFAFNRVQRPTSNPYPNQLFDPSR
jgi:hypothetical protein